MTTTTYGFISDVHKAPSNHFHEATHKAHDRNVQPIKEGEFVDELFWNTGHGDNSHFGLLRVQDGQVAYQNVDLRKYQFSS